MRKQNTGLQCDETMYIYIHIYRRKFSLHELLEDIVVLRQPHVWKTVTTVRVNGLLGMPLNTQLSVQAFCTAKHSKKKG